MNKINKKVVIAIMIILIGIVFRVLVINFESNDYKWCLKYWWQAIVENGKIESLSLCIGNYQPSYLFLLSIVTYIISDSLIGVKMLSFIFDILLSISVYFIAKKLKLKEPLILASITFSLPEVIVNSGMIAQCDSIFTAFVMLFVLFIIMDKPKLACVFYGVALSLKLQAIFIAPIFLYLLITRKIKIYDLLFCILGFFILLSPGIIQGKTLNDIFDIYFEQTILYQDFTGSCPNFYALLDLNYVPISDILRFIIVILVILFTAVIVLLKDKKKLEYSNDEFMMKTMLVSVIVPFFLPQMLDRYFYLTNIFVLLYFWNKKGYRRIILIASIAWTICVLVTNLVNVNVIQWNMYNILNINISAYMTFYVVMKVYNFIKNDTKYRITLPIKFIK